MFPGFVKETSFAYDSFYRSANWQLKFAWWPQRCNISNELIWLKLAYCGTAVYTGPGTPVFEYKWHTKVNHLIWQLKRKT